MADTVKIERPLFCRRVEDRGGRENSDLQGKASKVKTRIEDSRDVLLTSLTDSEEQESE